MRSEGCIPSPLPSRGFQVFVPGAAAAGCRLRGSSCLPSTSLSLPGLGPPPCKASEGESAEGRAVSPLSLLCQLPTRCPYSAAMTWAEGTAGRCPNPNPNPNPLQAGLLPGGLVLPRHQSEDQHIPQ